MNIDPKMVTDRKTNEPRMKHGWDPGLKNQRMKKKRIDPQKSDWASSAL
jgi:hypothetical protein